MAAGNHIQPDQLAHAQAAAVHQLHHGGIARLYPRVTLGIGAFGKAHRIIHRQRLGQRLG
ncbi:hypothetical protein D3C71_2202400 [compost metagenome]